MAIIPGRVVHNWDFTPFPVCQASLQQLRITSNKPLIKLEELNPRLFSFVHELNLVKRLRQELCGMRKYLLVCRVAKEDHLLWKNVDTPHLIESLDMYSLQDLVDTQTGELPTKMHNLVDLFTQHIKKDCELCRGRGHICEVCSNEEILYPFDATAYICNGCNVVLHKHCIERKDNQCPKCKRIQDRMEVNQTNGVEKAEEIF